MRLPLLFLIVGLVLKGLLVLLWRSSQAPELLALLIDFDPLAFRLAEKGVALFFDPRRIVPGPGEALSFEIMLVALFGIESMVVGFLAEFLMRRRPWKR